jgi:uncharacterized protein YfiM (DUF2279 family)
MEIRNTLVALTVALSCCNAIAEPWTGPDKTKHLAVGLVIGAATDYKVGCAVGAAKEVWDSQHKNHTASFKDFAVTCLGAAIGSPLSVRKESGVWSVTYEWRW